MRFLQGSRAILTLAFGTLLLTAGCAPIRDHQGYLLDDALATAIQPGVDNRESVQSTLGRPTFVGQFDPRDWYYISRSTRQLAFGMPRPSEQTVLHVRFDEAGNVERVERTGLELVARIDPSNEETPTLGRNRSLFDELFGNIGAVGQTGRGGQTADNPQ
jgi:outer membrane protein assembly factor BamE (lipoprotein component of BamABCDE complex)